MHLLKQSTAATVIVGPVLDSAGAAVTTAVVGDFRLAKEGTSAVLSGATVTHDANGYYLIALTTTNTNTVGRLAIYSNNTAQSMGTTRFMVLLPSVYDALVTNAVNTSGGLPSATGNVTTLAGAISTFAGGAVASVTAAVTVGTNNDKTGYSLTQSFPSNFSSLAITVGGAVTAGTVSDKTGYSLTQSFPANFATLGINSSGHVSRVTLVDTTTTNSDMRGTDNALLAASYTPAPTAAAVADAVWDEAMSDHTTSTSYGGRIIRAANSNVTAQLTGSQHMACDVHAFQPDVIDAAAIAADAVTELQAGLATAANLTIVSDRVSYCLTALVGACSDAQTAAETYTLSIGGSTFTVDYSGLDSSGNRSTTTLTKV
jgi:hypothetical protein